jgi:hypothetical protein
VPTRPLLLVAALAGGDYLLWTWSSDGGSATIALFSGLALAPLILALIWLTSVAVARLLLGRGTTTKATSHGRRRPVGLRAGTRRRQSRSRPAAECSEQAEMQGSASGEQSSEKLAA